ncbi:heavy metal translocating P-type ATPase [Pectinatus frisingensis]|uniref:heavy metal translocating P-type ATPase n=1 Tax=Pectinatus frisingensis TaxID=865 RepID=UPI0018C4A6F5|nr:HAD-IC family P-type ATPase [Pectinatus frisingensis]
MTYQFYDFKHLAIVTSTSILFDILLLYIFFAPIFILPLPEFIAGAVPSTLVSLRLLLFLPIVFINYQYYIFASGVFKGKISAELLVALGTLLFTGLGIYNFILVLMGYSSDIGGAYFEVIGTVLTLLTAEKSIERYFNGKMLIKQSDFEPDQVEYASVLDLEDNREKQLLITAIKPDDIISIKPGQRIPADGIVFWGEGDVDEGSFTGIKTPVHKITDDKVYAHTFNKSGTFQYRAACTSGASLYYRLLKAVREAQSDEIFMEKIIDTITKYMTVFTFFTALVSTGIGIYLHKPVMMIILAGAIVLVVGYPQIIMMMRRNAVVAALKKCSESGIFVKNADSTKYVKHIDTLILGKTGIITKGKPVVADIIAEGVMPQMLLSLAASAEKNCDHLIAKAIVTAAVRNRAHIRRISSMQEVPGSGVEALINGEIVRVGTAAWLEKENIDISDQMRMKAFQSAKAGNTVIYIALGRYCHGLIMLTDPIEYKVRTALSSLRKMAINVVVFSGSDKNTLRAITDELAINQYRAGLTANDKARETALLHVHGLTIAAVGNTESDAALLKTADIGIMLGGSISIDEPVDIIVPAADLRQVAAMFQFFRQLSKQMKQNIAIAVLYNILAVIAATGLFYYDGLFGFVTFLAAGWVIAVIIMGRNSCMTRPKQN